MKGRSRVVLTAGVVRRLRALFRQCLKSDQLAAQVKFEMIRLETLIDRAERERKGNSVFFNESVIRAILRVLANSVSYQTVKEFIRTLMNK